MIEAARPAQWEIVACPCGTASQPREVFRTATRQYVGCSDCGLVFLSPRLRAGAVADYYRERYDDAYGRAEAGPARTPVFRSVLAHLSSYRRPPGRLLDIGCGDGLFLDLCGKEGWTGFGVEVSTQAAARAEIRGITLLTGTWLEEAESDSDHGERFDVVTLVNVLDSLLDPLAALRRIKHVLAPNGLVLIRVQNGAFHLPLRRIVSLIGAKYWQAFQLFVYTPTALRNLLRAAELEPISMRNSAPSAGPLTGAERTGSRLIWRIAGAGVWTFARAAHAVSGGRLIWAPSFEVIARSEGAPA